jgi:acetoin:2,6-dichlorophenolindophenol oxidoreductase subunit beta
VKISFAEGLAKAIYESVSSDPRVFLIGSGFMGLNPVARALLNPLLEKYPDRILAVPISELALAGAGTGAAMCGQRPLVDLSTGSFIFQAFAQVVNEAANIHYMTGGQTTAPVTFYSLAGIRGGGAAQHSHRTQAMLGQVPGLQILTPGVAEDAYWLLKWALSESQNPSAFISHALLLAETAECDLSAPMLPVGKARVLRPGRDVTIIAHSVTVPRALRAADLVAQQRGVEPEVVDLRTLCPLDRESMVRSVAKTGRAVIADECHFSFGVGAELAATLARDAFSDLKAPVYRVATADVPIPFSPPLESALIVTSEKIAEAVLAVLDFRSG